MFNNGIVREGSSSSLHLYSISYPWLAPRHGIPYQHKGRRSGARILGTPLLEYKPRSEDHSSPAGAPTATFGKPGDGPESAARRLFSKRDVFTGKPSNYPKSYSTTTPADDFTFASETVAADINFCNTLYTQGHFFSDWQSITALYPASSPAKAKGFLDARILGPYYYGNGHGTCTVGIQ